MDSLTHADMAALFDRVAERGQPVAVLGSMNADYTVETERLPLPGETVSGGLLRVLPGGKSANQASAAARIGANVLMFGALGDDDNASMLLHALGDAGVDMSAVERVSGSSGATVITVDARAENTIVYSAGSNATINAEYVDRIGNRVASSAVLGLCFESPMEAVIRAASIAHRAGVTVLLNDSPFRQRIPDALVANADILLVNEHEMSRMLGVQTPSGGDWSRLDWRNIAARMDEYGFAQAIVTLGAQGAYVLTSDGGRREAIAVPAVKTQAVDTTGCGDAFMGSVLAGLSSGMSLLDSARLGSLVAAYAATGLGAQAAYGNAAEILDRFAPQS